MIKVLIVDDSVFMRNILRKIIESDPTMEVVGVAADGLAGLKMVHELDPDVVTLDVEMPRLNGLEALRRIMMEAPRPCIMVSTLTAQGADATLKALEIGAVDYIEKPSASPVGNNTEELRTDLLSKIKIFSKKKIRAIRKDFTVKPIDLSESIRKRESGKKLRDIVIIGVSTGGPPVVQKILSALPKELPASVIIAQHMPGTFTGPFASRLNNISEMEVKEVSTGDVLEHGHVYIAQGGKHLVFEKRIGKIILAVKEPSIDPSALYKPSVGILMNSASEYAKRVVAVMLTGMGSDGSDGYATLKSLGARTIAQDAETCVVYGMPKAVIDNGDADEILPVDEIAKAIIRNIGL